MAANESRSFFEELQWRGLVSDATPGVDAVLRTEKVVAYIGFDPSASSLHVGSLVPVMALARMQRCGHSPIAIAGGGTGLIGDPAGKKTERPLLTQEQVEFNLQGIKLQLSRFLDFEGTANAARIVNNADWLTTISLTDFLRDIGKHFKVNVMLTRDSVRRRLDSEEGISFTEFSYMLLQAYDFLVLYQRYGCTLQMGGSDQWGNIVAGADLIGRVADGKAHGIVFPLVTSASGEKFGKTEAGTIWLDPERTSPYHFYQFWLRTDDRDVSKYLKYFTWLGAEEIAELETEIRTRPEAREGQRRLAEEVTRMVHGDEALEQAQRVSELLLRRERREPLGRRDPAGGQRGPFDRRPDAGARGRRHASSRVARPRRPLRFEERGPALYRVRRYLSEQQAGDRSAPFRRHGRQHRGEDPPLAPRQEQLPPGEDPPFLAMNELLERLKTGILSHHVLRSPKKRKIEILLGNDREIGQANRSQEKRVGITPDQVLELREFFTELGVELSVLVMQGAGQRAGFADSDFVAKGAEILTTEELRHHDGPPDVVHALKEPSRYESSIPRPFCRIGALHTGDFEAGGGLAGLLKAGRADHHVAIFDGSHTGAPEAFRIPIRGGMSILAGEIAADWVLDHLRRRGISGHAVVVGGGNAGQSAVRKLAAVPEVTGIHLFDSAEDAGRLARIGADLEELPKAKVEGISGTDDARLLRVLDDAVAVVFAVARPREAAPKVVHVNTLKQRLAEGAVVVDISIDEKGAILDPDIRRTWSLDQIIEHLSRAFGSHRNRVYRALSNMPRAYPQRASVAHGETVLPYLATLLFLAAREGGAAEVIRFLERLPYDGRSADPFSAEPAAVLGALVQDLRNGMAFYPHGNRLVVSPTVADRASVFDFLYRQEIPFEFSVPAAAMRSQLDREREKTAVGVFPEPISDCLKYIIDRDLRCTVISHPGIDGTKTENAEQALGVGAEKVLKTLVFRSDDRFIAAICTGRKHVSEDVLRELTGAREVRLATADEVLKVTGHTKGGVPAVQVFAMNQLAAVYVDEEVMKHDAVYGSAGTEFAGMRITPSALKPLGGRVVRITPEDSRLRRHERKTRKLIEEIEKAIEEDDDASAHRAVTGLQQILEEPPTGMK